MKRTTRLSIEFQHREVTVTIAGSTLHARGSELEAADTPTVCPACGSVWLTLVGSDGGDIPTGFDPIRQALQQSGLHLQVSQAGHLRVCQRSFEELKEKL